MLNYVWLLVVFPVSPQLPSSSAFSAITPTSGSKRFSSLNAECCPEPASERCHRQSHTCTPRRIGFLRQDPASATQSAALRSHRPAKLSRSSGRIDPARRFGRAPGPSAMLLCPSFSLSRIRARAWSTFFPHGNSTDKLCKAIRKFQRPSAVEIKQHQDSGPTTEAGRLGVWLNASKRGGSISLGGHGGPRASQNGIDSAYGHQLPSRPTCAPDGQAAAVVARGASQCWVLSGTFYSGKHVE